MRFILALCVAVLAVVAASTPAPEAGYQRQFKIADKELLERQKKILFLFKRINQPIYDAEYEDIVKNFKIEELRDKYAKPEVVDKIIEFYRNDYKLPKGAIFSVTYPVHLEQAIAVFDLLYYAPDFDSFYKAACVCRYWVNEGLFLYSFSVAIVHRPDCYGIILPPIYEMFPYYFFDEGTINEAYKDKQTRDYRNAKTGSGQPSGTIIRSNYTGNYLNIHSEQSLAYYLEDVGLNSFYYTYYLYYPFWMDGERYGIKTDRRGELYLFVYQQLFSRYYLERLSNGMGQINALDVDAPVETPYYPSLRYPNGLQFPERPRFAKLSDYFYNYGEQVRSSYAYSYTYYKDFKRRIADAIDRGYALDKYDKKVELYNEVSGLNSLGNLLQSSPDSPCNRFYGPWLAYGRHLLGYSYTPLDKYKVAPSVLEHMETSLRDPGFYELYKQLMLFYRRYQSRLAPYKRDELAFPGVSVEKVEIDRLTTYFDDFRADLSQGVFYSEDELRQKDNNYFVFAKQYRLNHKPFTYKISINSEKDTDAVVKIFIGPKYDEYNRYINMSQNRWNFFEVDKFVYSLKSGSNLIKRSSYESKFFADDKPSYYELLRKVSEALEGRGQFSLNGRDNYFEFPARLMLPRGNYGGYPFQFYFFVYPYKAYSGNKAEEWTYFYPRPGVGGPYLDDYPLYYPFDRPIKYEMLFEDISNGLFYDTKIYLKRDINSVLSED